MKNLFKIALVLACASPLAAQQNMSLEEALQYAEEHNVQVQKAKLDKTIADKKVKETTGIGLPQINAQGRYNDFLKLPVQLLPAEILGGTPGQYVPVQFGQKHTVDAGVTLTQLLFNGSYIVGLQSAKAYKETTSLVEEKTKISIEEAIRLSYAAILVSEETLKTFRQNKETIEKTLFETKETYKVGLIEYQNVEQLEYSYKLLLTNIQNLERDQKKLKMAFKYLIGFPLQDEVSLITPLMDIVLDSETLIDQSLGDLGIEEHIDYRLRKNALKISELQLKLEKSKYLPSLSGAVSSSYNGNGNTFNFFSRDQQWFNTSLISIQLDVPIFSGLQRKYSTQQAKLNVQKAQLDLQDVENELTKNIYEAKTDYDNAYNTLINTQELQKLSESIYKKQQIKFKEGLGTSFELQQAENQLYDSQAKFYQAALNLISSKIKLDQALGRINPTN